MNRRQGHTMRTVLRDCVETVTLLDTMCFTHIQHRIETESLKAYSSVIIWKVYSQNDSAKGMLHAPRTRSS